MSININHTEFYSKFHFGPLSPNYDNLFGPSYLPYLSVVFVLFWVTLLVGGIYDSFSFLLAICKKTWHLLKQFGCCKPIPTGIY